MFLWCDIAVAVQSIIPTFLSILARLSAGFVPFLFFWSTNYFFVLVNPQFSLITMVKFVMEKKKYKTLKDSHVIYDTH